MLLTLERTGSNLLCDALLQTGRAGTPGEWFNGSGLHERALLVGAAAPGSEPDAPVLTSLTDYVEGMAKRFCDDGVFAAKVHRSHYERLECEGLVSDPLDLVPRATRADARVVLLSRGNHRRQAISTLMARRSGVYAVLSATGQGVGPVQSKDEQPTPLTPSGVTPETIEALDSTLATIIEDEEGWRRWSETSGWPVMSLTYEELCHDYENAVARTFRHVVDVDMDSKEVPVPRTRIQRDETTEQILELWLNQGGPTAADAPRRC